MRNRFYPVVGMLATATSLSLFGLTGSASAVAQNAQNAPAPTAPTAPAAAAPAGLPPATAKAAALPSGTRQVCPPPVGLLQEQCQLFIHSAVQPRRGVTPGTISFPFSPSDLRSAYGLTTLSQTAGTGETVAVVDAFRDPYIQADLNTYRNDMGLPLCNPTSSPAGCLTVLNQHGGPSPLPAGTNAGWDDETALDVEMVLAICPNCHIDLFEANSADLTDLGTAVNSAAKAAKFISGSWSGLDFPGESAYDTAYFNHPGVAIAFASGDYGYAASYPASSQLVTSVGGTYLSQDGAGNWTQTVWDGQQTGAGTGTGSGCSSGEPQPAWEPDAAGSTAASWCANRTQNDVAAEASGPYGTYFYSSASSGACGGLCEAYGTSVATPIIAATYALAGTPAPGTYPASYPYQNSADLTHVTTGANGTCEASRAYLCNAGSSLGDGYNGPTGLGTPNGSALQAFTNTVAGNVVSVINPGSYDLQVGVRYSLPAIKAYDSGSGQTLSYQAAGLPAGLAMNSATGAISGKVTTPVNDLVHITVRDGTGARSTVSFRIAVVKSLITSYRAGIGEVRLDLGGMCLNDAGNSAANGTLVRVWKCNGNPSENWLYLPSGAPGGVGTVRIHGKCMNIEYRGTSNGSKVNLYTCNGHANQAWEITGVAGELYNPVSGKCLNDPQGSTRNGTQLLIWACNDTTRQAWVLPASPITSGVAGKCVNDARNSGSNGTAIVSWACDGAVQQKFTLGLDGTVRIHGKCLNVYRQGTTDGSVVNLYNCNGLPAEYWALTAYGTIENLNSGKCLAVPGNSARNGPQLAVEDCYGQPGEVWAVS